MTAIHPAGPPAVVSPVPDTVPSLRLQAAPGAGPLAAALREAVELLLGAGRLRLARPGERADLLHTVGEVDGDAGLAAYRVHTVDRIPLRGHELVATRRWARRERRRAARCAVWLTHGRTAGRIVVEAALAPGERVRCLPVLSPWHAPGAGSRDGGAAERGAVRRELGIRPGVRLVVGVVPARRTAMLGDWAAAVERLGRSDVHVLRLSGEAGRAPAHPAGRLPLPALLEAADLFVAAGQDLSAVSPGVSALAMGLPVVAVTTDSAAELVTSGLNGNVVAPRDDAIADAVAAHLDEARPPRRVVPTADDRPAAHALARGLLEIYRQALSGPGTSRRWTR
ncbi:glycosyltransferase [Pseudonocardia acidicola]|uniref:Glycosyltransferase n=1 Tax=Pseudonocardia acidicola TaxID=2724939 RepID=A0ABX1S529_9PSEU|nr:glycosyltransferase [Pseudonocardia acidicola]NMH96650.1 glycosyltransferase [Pseudonocardia acidicola]